MIHLYQDEIQRSYDWQALPLVMRSHDAMEMDEAMVAHYYLLRMRDD
jgi:hypothetical protein